jgi:hypothetical protein
MNTKQDTRPRLVVCAAIKHDWTGIVVCGVRHGNCLNAAIAYKLDDCHLVEIWECGFVDQHGVFMSRAEAWTVADAAGQIRRSVSFERNYDSQRKPGVGDKGLLFSENLY